MAKMVINFFPDGTRQHTLKDSIFKLEGMRHVDRVSEIVFYAATQKFYIRWLRGPYESLAHTDRMMQEYGVDLVKGTLGEKSMGHSAIWFDSYEDAVEHEIDMLNAMRKAGVRF